MIETASVKLPIPTIDIESRKHRLENVFLGIHKLLLEDEKYRCGPISEPANTKTHFLFIIQEQWVICTLGPMIDVDAEFEEAQSQPTYPSQELQQLVEKIGRDLAVEARLKSKTSFSNGQRQTTEVKYQIR